MSNRMYTQFMYSCHRMPVVLTANWTVAATDTGGLGLTGLVGKGFSSVYMHTSATPATGNPNPASGIILVKLADNYNTFYDLQVTCASALTTAATSTTNHVSYVIASLGTATLAQWQAAGLPVGVTPAVGAAFVATATGTIGGSATVQPTATTGSGIDHVEILGDPVQTIAPILQGAPSIQGAYMILQCFSGGAVTAPADGTKIYLRMMLGNSTAVGT